VGLAAGQIALDTDLSALVSKTYQKPIGRSLPSAAQAVPVTTQTALLFGAEDYDTSNAHSTSVNTSRITPTVPGYYRFSGTAFFATAGSGIHSVEWRKNGVTRLPSAWRQTSDGANTSMGPLSQVQPMNGTTDYMELTVILGLAMTTAFSFPFTCSAEWEFIRDL
jgi:hypothetical protein